ncbi:MAG: DEAD/DEAH box helicase [Veillonellaceae bacterium]|nr:DEAD/DEAH box helicase [Veillonellaceae bacterium]
MLTDGQIRSEAALGSSYTRGCQYHRDGYVREVNFYPDERIFQARVQGRELYTINVKLDAQDKIKKFDCDCPAFYSYNGACKHIIAVLKSIQKDWANYFEPGNVPLTSATQKLLNFFKKNAVSEVKQSPDISVKLAVKFNFNSQSNRTACWLEFLIGNGRMYVLRNIPQLLAALENSQEIVYGKSFTLQPSNMKFDEYSERLLKILNDAYTEEKQRETWSYYAAAGSVFADPRQFKLTNSSLRQFFDAMGEQPFNAVINHKEIAALQITSARPPLRLLVNAIDGGLKLELDRPDQLMYGLDADCNYLYYDKVIYKVDKEFATYIKPLIKCFSETRKPAISIPTAAISDFHSAMLPALERIVPVKIDEMLFKRFYKQPLEKSVYLDKAGVGMSARVEFRYGEVIINPGDAAAQDQIAFNDKWVLRSFVDENKLIDLFTAYGFKWVDGELTQTDEEATYCFLQEGLPELRDIAEVFYSDDFKNIKIRPTGRIVAGIRLNSESDLLELSLQYQNMNAKELIELLAAYKLKKRYYRLPEGGFIPLDSSEFEAVAGLVADLGLRLADIEKDVIELPKYRALYLDSLAREMDDFELERSSTFKRMVQDIREPADIDYAVPENICGKLRGYQKTGFKWLKTLASYGLGGILADDMGLGKTLQVLTFILSEKKEETQPSLVIAPTSLVYNWQDEAAKFTPSLNVLVLSGSQEERLDKFDEIDQADIVVTSYGMVKRDIEFYKTKRFKYCFIDEAQHVKNPNTLNAKAVKRIRAKCYFALTGTPIENTLTELWSIFDFIMPGYLRSHKAFVARFEAPIVRNGDEKALHELSRHIKPFILRRMKKTVLKELPEKIESKMSSEMTEEQAKVYAAWLVKARTEFENELKANGMEKSHIKILSLLTRLRQLCCHPALFIDNYSGGSGKLDMLQEILKDAVSGGHRVLLFSQFTGMLDLIKQELNALEMSYYYLDGSTKAEERMRLVKAFNAGDKDVFLISLKAGGTGLNLTGADVVIHFDPWWNPAVEDQATDRAYRIGQKNVVQVYKLIAKNTIEEKIYELQQRKKQMIDTLIKPGENFLNKMSEEEIRNLFAE